MFQNVHPNPGSGHSGRVDSDAVEFGRNAENSSLSDKRYVRCRQCGFMCHMDRDMRAPVYSAAGAGTNFDTDFESIEITGWGLSAWGSQPWGDSAETRSEPIVTSGCPLCGAYTYA